LRFLIRWSLRKKELCESEDSCPEGIETRDAKGELIRIDRCHECPKFKLEHALEGPVGGVINRAFLLLYALSKPGLSIGLGEIPCDEFAAIRIIEEEQAKHEQDLDKQANP
jgi:hypothetical protein